MGVWTVDTAGDSTISPHSSSSSNEVSGCLRGALVSSAPRLAQGSKDSLTGAGIGVTADNVDDDAQGSKFALDGAWIGDIFGAIAAAGFSWWKLVVVEVLLCDIGSLGRELRSIEAALPPCL